MSINAIKEGALNIEYGWSHPGSLVVLVPGLSLLVQKIQSAHILEVLKTTYPKSEQIVQKLSSPEYKKLGAMYDWHHVGSGIQCVALLALSAVTPWVLLPTCFSLYQFVSCTLNLGRMEIGLNYVSQAQKA